MNQREIKFRAWDEKNKRLFQPHTGNTHAEFFAGFNSDGLEVSEYVGKGAWKKYPLMQFTGLKDKNGKEIYEGDVIVHKGERYEVIWNSDVAAFQGYKRSFSKDMPLGCEIIGNIYENPELLTV